jgi:NAD(P)-dependent dehydrogenase (short-subunit alcohol dehydrogenase family)
VTDPQRHQVVFISGGTSGINLGVAKGFAARGASLLVFGRDPQKAEAAAAAVRAVSGAGTVMAGSADVRNPAAISELFARAVTEVGAPDVVIAGAAGNFMAPAAKISPNGFKTVVDIDLLGTYNVFRLAFDVARRPGASFIAITAPQGALPMPRQAHVCAAKAGVNMVVKVLAMEWGQSGVRVNAISPGPILGTEGVERMAPTDADKSAWAERIASRRFGSPEDIANMAIFLSSPEGSYVNGSIVDCDGGMHLGDAAGTFQ